MKRTVVSLVLFTVLLLNGRAQRSFPALPPGADTNDATIVVKVVDAVSGQPLPGSIVMMPSLTPAFGWRGTNQWQFPADAEGRVSVRVPAVVVAFNYFSLAVSNAGYAGRNADWNVEGRPVRSILPGEHTFRLERGATIGGYVHDERGAPLAGVQVMPWGSGAYGNDSSGIRAREYSSLLRTPTNGVFTDSKGFWSLPHVPQDIVQLNLDVIRPDGAHTAFITPAPDSRYNNWQQLEEIPMDALRATNAILKLKDGLTVRGIVVDESGQPVPNAVINERAGSSWNALVQKTTNDAAGRFAFPHRTGKHYLLSAEAEGFAVTTISAAVAPGMPEAKIVLSRAQPLKLRVLDDTGKAVVGAEVSPVDYRNRGQLITWKGTTDGDGRVVWSGAPTQSLSLAIAPTNLSVRLARVKPSSEEQTIRVPREPHKTISIRIRATSLDGAKPVSRYVVWQDLQPHGEFRQMLCSGTNGEAIATLKREDFPQQSSLAFRLQIRAEGHAPQATETYYFDEGDLEFGVALKPARAPAGIVLRPDGERASGATVLALEENSYVHFYGANRFSQGQGVQQVVTSSDGSFKFDAADEDNRIVIMHEAGFASMSVGDLSAGGQVTLQPYARIDGVIPNANLAGQSSQIYLRSPLVWAGGGDFNINYSVAADKSGRFTFTNLPPGDYLLFRMPHPIMGAPSTESHRMVVSLKRGETRRLDYTLNGRRVTGRVDAGAEVDWKNDAHSLTAKIPPGPSEPNYYEFVEPRAHAKARREHARSKEVLDYERRRQQFQLTFDRDGNFQTDDVPPGTYELTIKVTKPLKNGRNRYERSNETVGLIKREVTIPAGPAGEDFDLGSFEMEIKDAVVAQTQPLDFNAETFDGAKLRLLDLRGKPVVLAFWGRWAPGSVAKLEGVHAAINQIDASARPALVSVNLDANPDASLQLLQNLAAGWRHTKLPGSGTYEVTERFGVDTVPAILLLDAEGRVLSRDLDGKRLASSVKRLSAKKN